MTEIARLMPDPFFVGSPLATTVSHILPRSSSTGQRDLERGERRLGWFILPPFQRPPVWTPEQQIKLLESIWLELPVGAYIYNQSPSYNHRTDQWLIDGQQRVTSIIAYLDDAFPVFGYRWSELPRHEQRAFEMKSFPCIRLQMQDADALADIYDRLAYGGTPHEPK